MATIVVHDKRLEGDPPSGAIQVDGSISISSLLSNLTIEGRKQRNNKLIIMCHSGDGSGLQLCKENLTLANVNSTQVLEGLFDRITLYACEAALTYVGTTPNMSNEDSRGTSHDGRMFCSYLAAHTGAVVVASDTTQIYHSTARSQWDLWISPSGWGGISFGRWEGSVWWFHPGGLIQQAI